MVSPFRKTVNGSLRLKGEERGGLQRLADGNIEPMDTPTPQDSPDSEAEALGHALDDWPETGSLAEDGDDGEPDVQAHAGWGTGA